MGRVFAILVLVAAVCVGMEVFNEGVEGAFGGAFAFLAGDSRAGQAELRSTRERVQESVQSAHDEAALRRERLLAD